jgi:predicted Ser/Thr protein kinase
MDLQPGQQLGAYRLASRIGAGGMGEVWRADDTRLRRTVAIKILPKALAENAESQARFVREARMAAQLNHPNIATIHAIEQDQGRSFIVMEYVSGEPLTRRIKQGPMPEADICAIGKRVADALDEAHRAGIIHRDIKPDNIVISGDRVKVLDFGIAKQIGLQGGAPVDSSGVVTEVGMILGTIYYMSPEQALGKPLDGRTDLFSLGVVIYQALTGRLPFRGETITETLTQIIRDEPPPIRQANPAVSEGMAAIVARCLQKNRERRYAAPGELIADLDRQMALSRAAGQPTVVVSSAAAATLPMSAPATAQATIEMTSPAPRIVEPVIAFEPASKPRPRRGWIPIAVVMALVVVGLAALMLGRADGSRRRPSVAVPPVPSPSAAPSATPLATPAVVPVIREEAIPAPGKAVSVVATPAVAQPEPEATKAPEEARPVPVRNADHLYQAGLDLLRKGNRPRAMLAFQSAVAKDPHHAPARMKLAHASLVSGRLDEARQQYSLALADRDRLSEREARLAEIGAAAAREDRETARELGAAYDRDYPGDLEFAALQRLLRRGETRPAPNRRRF